MIYALFSLCILASGLSFTFGYLEGKRRGYSQGYSEAEDVWKKTVLDIEKSTEERMDIFESEMTMAKDKYQELADRYVDDEKEYSGLLGDDYDGN